MGTIKNDTVIHCTTEQETVNVFNVLKEFDYKLGFTSGKGYWNKRAHNSLCYRIDVNYIQFCDITFYKSCYPENIITAKEFLKEYMKEEQKSVKLTLTQAREMYPGACKDMKILLETTFPELIEPVYPKTHEELQQILVDNNRKVYYSEHNSIEDYIPTQISEYNNDVSLNKQRVKEHLIFTQLITLMDYYNQLDEFYPDWSNSKQSKFVINNYCGEVIISERYVTSNILAFKTNKMAHLFLDNFKNLIEQCKNLI